MPELGIKRESVKAEVDHITSLANKVEEDARNLNIIAKKISAEGIRGVDWYDGSFTQKLNKLESNKVSEAVAEIKLQAQKLVGVEETSVTFGADKE